MVERAIDATFEPVELTDGGGWHLRLTSPAMLPRHMGVFRTEAEAREWIGAKSVEWLVKYGAS